jgi:hypothetical protein
MAVRPSSRKNSVRISFWNLLTIERSALSRCSFESDLRILAVGSYATLGESRDVKRRIVGE